MDTEGSWAEENETFISARSFLRKMDLVVQDLMCFRSPKVLYIATYSDTDIFMVLLTDARIEHSYFNAFFPLLVVVPSGCNIH
jgi:hypothetical protein